MAKQAKLTRAEIMYSASRSDAYNEPYFGHVDNVGIYDATLVNSVYPIDALTGRPVTDLGRLTSPHLTDAEREVIVRRLKPEYGTYMPSSLSDEDILSLVPPRYFQDAVDVQMWRDYLAKDVMPHLDDADKAVVDDIVSAPSPVEIEDEE